MAQIDSMTTDKTPRKLTMFERLLYCPIASIVLIIGLILYFILGGWIYIAAIGLAMLWISIRLMERDANFGAG
jgi:CHASE2 domain-containing sensor protein